MDQVVQFGQAAWQDASGRLWFGAGYTMEAARVHNGLFEPEYRDFAALDAIVTHLQSLGRAHGWANAAVSRDALLLAGAPERIPRTSMLVAFELLRCGGFLKEKDGLWRLTEGREGTTAPSTQSRGIQLRQRPDMKRAYDIIRSVLGITSQIMPSTEAPRSRSARPRAEAPASGATLHGAATGRSSGGGMAEEQMMTTTRVFISHASGDAKLAKALIELLEAGLDVPDGAIRCTSVDGYK